MMSEICSISTRKLHYGERRSGAEKRGRKFGFFGQNNKKERKRQTASTLQKIDRKNRKNSENSALQKITDMLSFDSCNANVRNFFADSQYPTLS